MQSRPSSLCFPSFFLLQQLKLPSPLFLHSIRLFPICTLPFFPLQAVHAQVARNASHFVRPVLSDKIAKISAQRGPLAGQGVHHFVGVSKKAVMSRNEALSTAHVSVENSLGTKSDSHDILRIRKSEWASVGSPAFQHYFKALLCHRFSVSMDNDLETLGYSYSSSFSVQDLCAVLYVSPSARSKLALYVGPHTSEVTDVQNDCQDSVQVLFSDGEIKKTSV